MDPVSNLGCDISNFRKIREHVNLLSTLTTTEFKKMYKLYINSSMIHSGYVVVVFPYIPHGNIPLAGVSH